MTIWQWIKANAPSHAVGFVFGIVGSFIASILFTRWWEYRRFKKYSSLVGYWVEANDKLVDRPFAISNFFISTSDGKLKYSGDSYNNSAELHYDWWSRVLYIDDELRQISYIYDTKKIKDTNQNEGVSSTSEGFGWYKLSFDNVKKQWVIDRGYFLDVEEAVPRNCRMRRFEDVCRVFQLSLNPLDHGDRKKLVKLLIEKKDDARLRKFFGW
jgi:hypothetical protein